MALSIIFGHFMTIQAHINLCKPFVCLKTIIEHASHSVRIISESERITMKHKNIIPTITPEELGCKEAAKSKEFAGCSKQALLQTSNVKLKLLLNKKHYKNVSHTLDAIFSYFENGDTNSLRLNLAKLQVRLTNEHFAFPDMTYTNYEPDHEEGIVFVTLVLTSLHDKQQSEYGLLRTESSWTTKLYKKFYYSHMDTPKVIVEVV